MTCTQSHCMCFVYSQTYTSWCVWSLQQCSSWQHHINMCSCDVLALQISRASLQYPVAYLPIPCHVFTHTISCNNFHSAERGRCDGQRAGLCYAAPCADGFSRCKGTRFDTGTCFCHRTHRFTAWYNLTMQPDLECPLVTQYSLSAVAIASVHQLCRAQSPVQFVPLYELNDSIRDHVLERPPLQQTNGSWLVFTKDKDRGGRKSRPNLHQE
jgi:hypothetical protein